MTKKIVALSILFLIAFSAVVAPLEVYAQNSNIGVAIIQVTPSTPGTVGSNINVQGSIYTKNGSYQIFLSKTVVASGTSEGYYVNKNFTVPEVPAGTYVLLLRDVAINVNYSQTFTIQPAYSINLASPSVKEGDNVTFTVEVAGGQMATSYSVNVAVVLPPPLGTRYAKTIALGLPNPKGTASATVTFPDSSFDPSGSRADYAGTYTVYFNQSSNLAQNQFTVNFIDKTSYHRGETVNVRATGYQPNEPATITITSVKSGNVLDTVSATASADGVIVANWVVASNADVGSYTIKIAPQNNQKSIVDQETFTVSGYTVKVQTTNLAGEVVPGITIQAKDAATETVTNAVSDANGTANFNVEKGTIILTAFWNEVNVAETNITVTGDESLTLSCQLADLKITVKNTNGITMSSVDLNIVYKYQSGGSAKTGEASGKTDSSGSFTINSVLAGASYTIDASIYNQIFNAGNNTINNLPAQATVQVTVICPSETITLSVVGYNQEAIPGARIELVELSNGLFYSATTDSTGSAQIQATFGMYRARVFSDNTLINQTNVNVFSSSDQQIRCTLFGIQLSVAVVDFFGSPISNVNVTLKGPTQSSAVTSSNGKATFNNIVGGNIQIIAQASGTIDAYQAKTLTVNEPTSVQIKIDKYVALGSMLIPASSLIAVLIVVVAIIMFAIVEIYRRKRVKSAAAT